MPRFLVIARRLVPEVDHVEVAAPDAVEARRRALEELARAGDPPGATPWEVLDCRPADAAPTMPVFGHRRR